MKKTTLIISLLLPLISFAQRAEEIHCSVNNRPSVQLPCSGKSVEMRSFPEVKIKMKECFGYKSSERLTIETDRSSMIYRSVELPFKIRQDGYRIECRTETF